MHNRTTCMSRLQVCTSCDLEALSASGSCMPGTYTLTYTVANDNGITVTATRLLVVYQAASVSATLTLWQGLSSTTQVQQLVAALNNKTVQSYSDGLDLIVSKLGASVGLDASDIDITGAAYRLVSAGNYSVAVNATLYLYKPAGVHRADIRSSVLAAGAAAGLGAQHRRLLAADPQQMVSMPAAQAVANHLQQQPSSVVDRAGAGVSRVEGEHQEPLALLEASLAELSSLAKQHVAQGCVGSSSDAAGASCRHHISTAPDVLSGTRPVQASVVVSQQRRRLQQASPADQTLGDALQQLAGSLSALGVANFSTQALTTQSVDLLTVSAMHIWHETTTFDLVSGCSCGQGSVFHTNTVLTQAPSKHAEGLRLFQILHG